MLPEERERLAILESRFNTLEKTVDETQADVKTILAFINQSKGGWKTMAAVAGASGAIGALLAKLGITVGGMG